MIFPCCSRRSELVINLKTSPAAGHRSNEEGNLRISSRKDRLNLA